MTRCAVIKNGVVQNVIRLDGDSAVIVSEENPVGINYTYDDETGEFTAPPEPQQVTDDPQVIRSNASLGDLK